MLPQARPLPPSSRRFGGVVALIATLALLPGVARGMAAPASPIASPRLVLPRLEAARSGSNLEIRWTRADGRIEELELQLSLDDGRHYTLRVSPELDPRAGRFVWRVPNLASGEARLRLRFNRGGREIEGEPSEPFRIVAQAGEAAELRQIHEGTWWTGVRELDVPGAGQALSPFAENLGDGSGATLEAVTPRLSAADAPLGIRAPAVRVGRTEDAPAPRQFARARRSFPRRN